MITVEDFLQNHQTISHFYDDNSCNMVCFDRDVKQAMIEFAKLHVTEALKETSENFKMKLKEEVYELDMNDDWMEVDKNSILNAYSLDNIK